ncbi:hypothetical protein SMSP2_01151 [Limihaloglobus sulfuriphilus]|uniref:HD domain-containing protein n=1 Tax=Limihaloglobus sulfuriphilus TaxID=1851148 RepID=A0A1Q2MDP4_9BACT|nr:HD domain-containing protein [Limihaloglobus sulfuriphilus]AQQ70790.1 hypothetical protein SMSP2_01151 [Limihaloglobus sulfuriphilus]
MIKNRLIWFADFVDSHLCEDEFINRNIELKREHTKMVCLEMQRLCEILKLDPRLTELAMITALYHDLGRFPQIVEYRTFSDPQSCCHATESINVMNRNSLLEGLDETDSNAIKTAVKLHNKLDFDTESLDEKQLLLTRMIRDADKIDIYRVISEAYHEYLKDPQSYNRAIGFGDFEQKKATPEIAAAVIKGKPVLYAGVKTFTDRKLLHLGWLFQIHYDAALNRIHSRGYIKMLLESLPDCPLCCKVRTTVESYVKNRLALSAGIYEQKQKIT